MPPREMNAAEKHCRMADVVLCLGTRSVSIVHTVVGTLVIEMAANKIFFTV